MCFVLGFFVATSVNPSSDRENAATHSLMINVSALGYLVDRNDVASAVLVLKSNSDGLLVDLDKQLQQSSDAHQRESFKVWTCRYFHIRSAIKSDVKASSVNELSLDVDRIFAQQGCARS